MSETKEIHLIDKYIIYFFIYAFLGWTLETVYSYISLGYFNNRGFLIGPICPIYGFGMLILIIWLSRYKNNKLKLFIVSAIALTYFEYITGFILDSVFGLKWWDYSRYPFNINGRICLYFTIIWGIIGIIAINFIHPFIEKIVSKTSKKFPIIVTNMFVKVLIMILIIDFSLSCLDYLII